MAHAKDGTCVIETRERPNGGEIGYKREDPRWPRGKIKRPREGFLVGREVKESALEKKFLVGRELKESARDPS